MAGKLYNVTTNKQQEKCPFRKCASRCCIDREYIILFNLFALIYKLVLSILVGKGM